MTTIERTRDASTTAPRGAGTVAPPIPLSAVAAGEDPMAQPYAFADDADAAEALLAEIAAADHASGDVETVVDAHRDLDRHGPGAWRALSVTTESWEDAGDGEPGWVLRNYLFDMGYVPAETVAAWAPRITLHVWNASFERLVFERDGVHFAGLVDLMLTQSVLDAGAVGVDYYPSLADTAFRHLGVGMEGKKTLQLSYRDVGEQPELSDEQRRYSVQDAWVTARLRPLLYAACDAADRDPHPTVDAVEEGMLRATAEREMRAQPVIDEMSRAGLPLIVDGADEPIVAADVDPSEATFSGWRDYVAHRERRRDRALSRLAELTGQGQGMLDFAGAGETTFRSLYDPNKPKELRALLNDHATGEVRAYFEREEGAPRTFTTDDSVDKDVLDLLGGPIAETVREWARHEKLLNYSGEDLIALVHDRFGRVGLHSHYIQAVVRTGRLSGRKPNPQNYPPEIKRFVRPAKGRVVVHSDASQAELRLLAQVSGDPRLREAFADDADIHSTTSALMNRVDILALRGLADMSESELVRDELVALAEANRYDFEPGTDPATAPLEQLRDEIVGYATQLRKKGKTLNFGIVYGLRGRALARRLTLSGVPTTPEEADQLIEDYYAAYEKVAEWMNARDSFIDDLAANPPECDWRSTWLLARDHPRAVEAKKRLAARLERQPSARQISEELLPQPELTQRAAEKLGRAPDDDDLDAARGEHAAWVRWVLGFKAPVVVDGKGRAFAFESRTPGGRRRLFQVSADKWLDAVAIEAARDRDWEQLRDRFERDHGVALSAHSDNGRARPLSRAKLESVFSDTSRRDRWVEFALAGRKGHGDAPQQLMRRALGDRIRAQRNAYRNAPIQGGVADAVEDLFALLRERLAAYPSALVIQSVHDSVAIECDAAEARAVADATRDAFEEALARHCPDVKVVADVAISRSLAEDDDELLDDDDLAEIAAAA